MKKNTQEKTIIKIHVPNTQGISMINFFHEYDRNLKYTKNVYHYNVKTRIEGGYTILREI